MPTILAGSHSSENSASAEVFAKSANHLVRRFAALAAATAKLDSPPHPLNGCHRPPPPVPENVICFRRNRIGDLNRPQRGRALHHRHVLIVPLRGDATVCVDDRKLLLEPGKGLVVLPFQYHHYLTHAGRNIHWLFVTFEFAREVVLEPLRNVLFPITTPRAAQLRQLIRDQARRADPGVSELRLALLLAQIVPPRGPKAAGSSPENPTLMKVSHALQRHRPLTPTIPQLAAELGMSPSHLRARFRASCGVSLGRHMRELRLERACGLLRMNSMRITEVAEQCGFTSVHSFSRAFRLAYGVSPRAYRREGHIDGSTPRAS